MKPRRRRWRLAICYGCSPGKPAAPQTTASVAAPKPAPAPTPAPAKMETMICRNSQTGQSVACGTPNAVMVGMKEN